MDVLKLRRVTKRFKNLTAVEDLSFCVPEHSVFGFIGKNGAGKTTTMRMILGFLKPTSGDITVCGERVRFGDSKTNRHIGYLPDVPEFYGYMTPKEYLALCGSIAGLDRGAIAARTGRVLELTGLGGVNRRIRGFSRGMKQRLGIAQALLNKPGMLICDEPTSALDPMGRKEILDILAVAREDTTVVFSTHILSDVERICDRVGVVDKGRLVLAGTLSDIREEYRRDAVRIEMKSPDAAAALCARIGGLPRVISAKAQGCAIEATVRGVQAASADILNLILGEGIFILKFEVLEPTLENVFLEAVK